MITGNMTTTNHNTPKMNALLLHH